MVNPVKGLGRRFKFLVGKTKDEEVHAVAEPGTSYATTEGEPGDLGPICTAVHYGCMGLPQELIIDIMDLLQDDPRALKACSLTCKSMFVSTRHFIHKSLRVTPRTTRFIASMDECGLLQYVRQLSTPHYGELTQHLTLEPDHCKFQSLLGVRSLILKQSGTPVPEKFHQTPYGHFYPTLTSLTFSAFSHCHSCLVHFALQFPHLKNLCIEGMYCPSQSCIVGIPNFPTGGSPPLCGHLRLTGLSVNSRPPPVDPFHKLPNGMNFRSVEFDDYSGNAARHTLDACAQTVEVLTIFSHHHDLDNLLNPGLAKLAVLRKLVISIILSPFPPFFSQAHLLQALSTIESPVFCELTLEVWDGLYGFIRPQSADPLNWREVDELLTKRFSDRENFKFVVKAKNPAPDQKPFEVYTRACFPLLVGRGRIYFDT